VFQPAGDPVELGVYLLNTWDELEEPPEHLRDVEALRGFLDRRGFGAEAKGVGPGELTAVRALRGRLRSAFEAPDEETAVHHLNEVLGESRAVLQLEGALRAWRFRFAGPLLDVLAATTAWSLLEGIRVDGWDRFGRCAAAPCCCVFVDRSRNRSRRYCSELCADRAAQAAHRRRLRAGSPTRRSSHR
jgi:predicted RNA-binding Zn ribbon-like protein